MLDGIDSLTSKKAQDSLTLPAPPHSKENEQDVRILQSKKSNTTTYQAEREFFEEVVEVHEDKITPFSIEQTNKSHKCYKYVNCENFYKNEREQLKVQI